MAALSGLIPSSFSLKPRSSGSRHGGGVATAMVRLHGQRHGGASFVSPRCSSRATDVHEAWQRVMSLSVPTTRLKDFTRETCSIVVISLSGPSCIIPAGTREDVAYRARESLLSRSDDDHDIEEVAILSTRSRLEIYVLALCNDSGGVSQQVTDWMKSLVSEIGGSNHCCNSVEMLYDRDAVEHLFKVSSGLDDSDESEFLEKAVEVRWTSFLMARLVRAARNVSSRVRSSEASCAAKSIIVDEEADRFEAWRNKPPLVICSHPKTKYSDFKARKKWELCSGREN